MFMKLPEIENLLLQEMEEVKGGADINAVCKCETSAHQSTAGDDECICNSGAVQKTPSIKPTHPTEPKPGCGCNTAAGSKA